MKQPGRSIVAVVVPSVLALLIGCTTNIRDTAPGEDPAVAVEEARDDVRAMANETLQQLYARQPGAKEAVERAAGYAVFSNFGMKLMLAGGGSGRGLAVNNTTRQEAFMRMAEVQAGLGFGVRRFRLVWVFSNQQAFDSFINSGFEFGGQAALTAQAGSAGGGVAGAVSVSPGVFVYQLTDDGIAATLTIRGARYFRDRNLD